MLDANRPKDAPLHNEFEWDDSIAAEQFRESQARHIINCLCVVPTEADQEPVRAFFTISRPVYESLNVILSSAEKHDDLFRLALKELNAFRVKYKNQKQLESVFEAIEKVS